VVLVEELAASQTGTSDSMAECLRLRLGGGRSDEGSLGFGGRGSRREEADLFADGATKILESLLDVGGVVVGLVRVLGAIKSMLDHQHLWHVMAQADIRWTYVTASIFWWACLRASTRFSRSM
jgi:hypothetical protein